MICTSEGLHKRDTINMIMGLRKMSGFTIVEVSVSLVVATALVVGFMAFFGVLLVNSLGSVDEAKGAKQLQDALSGIQEGAMLAQQFERSTEIDGFSGGHGPSGHIAGAGPAARSIIMRLPATTADYKDPGRDAIYTSIDTSHNCPGNTPRRQVNVLYQYYLENSTLYRRTLVPNPLPTNICDDVTIYQKQTGAGGSAPQDVRIAQGITSMRVVYYADDAINAAVSDSEVYSIDNDEAFGSAVGAARVTVESTYESGGATKTVTAEAVIKRGIK